MAFISAEPIKKNELINIDPSAVRHPPLNLQWLWALPYLNHRLNRQTNQLLHFTKFKIVSREQKGAAELMRMLLSYADLEYEDVRLYHLDGKSLISKMPYGSLPVLWMDEAVYGEPAAIARLLARHMGLMGASEEEALVVEAVIQQVFDLKDSEVLQRAFEELLDQVPADNVSIAFNTLLPNAFKNWDKHIASTPGPFLVKSGLTVADMAIFDFVDQYNPHLKLQRLIDEHPCILHLIEEVKHHPSLIKSYFKQ